MEYLKLALEWPSLNKRKGYLWHQHTNSNLSAHRRKQNENEKKKEEEKSDFSPEQMAKKYSKIYFICDITPLTTFFFFGWGGNYIKHL